MGWTDARWTTQISDITTSTEFLNAIVTIVDPALVTYSGGWDIDANTPPTVANNGIIAANLNARVNWPLRAVADPGTADGNPTEVRPGRLSIPWSEYSGPLRNGLLVYTMDGGDNPDLGRYVMRIEEAINSSNSATRVMKVAVDGEANSNVMSVLQNVGYGDPIINH